MDIPTVKIKSDDHESGFVIINASTFNEAEHELFVEPGVESDDEPKKGKKGKKE